MDIVDRASKDTEVLDGHTLAEVRRLAASMPAGSPGECIECGGYNQRLVRGCCSPCRDLLKLA